MMNLLIVDDEELEVLTVEKLVLKTGIQFERIFKAVCMEDAVKILEHQVIHIMICDIEMPGGSGHELTEWVRNRSLDIKVIFLTGHAKFSYAAGAIRLQVSDYLLKPVKEAELKAVLLKVADKNSDVGQYNMKSSKMAMEEIKEYIKEHCDENLTREKVAQEFFFQPNYFSKVFSNETKMTFRDYLNHCRMEKAKRLLLFSDQPISQIALDVGYTTTAYFIKQFKERYHMTPKQYRQLERV